MKKRIMALLLTIFMLTSSMTTMAASFKLPDELQFNAIEFLEEHPELVEYSKEFLRQFYLSYIKQQTQGASPIRTITVYEKKSEVSANIYSVNDMNNAIEMASRYHADRINISRGNKAAIDAWMESTDISNTSRGDYTSSVYRINLSELGYHITYYETFEISEGYIELSYLDDYDKQTQVINFSNNLAHQLDDKSDMEKIKGIDAVLRKTPYDYSLERHDAHSAILGPSVVCQGYASAFQYMAEACGLECYYIEHEDENHAFNVVNINGKYYIYDGTIQGNNFVWGSTELTYSLPAYCANNFYIESKGF